MGRPTRCVPQSSPFLRFGTGLTTTSTSTTTIFPENLNQYIYIPESGKFCPISEVTTTSTTTSTSTTLPPITDYLNCYEYNVNIISNSAVVKYVPCNESDAIQELMTQDKNICITNSGIRLLSGSANFNYLNPCTNLDILKCSTNNYLKQNINGAWVLGSLGRYVIIKTNTHTFEFDTSYFVLVYNQTENNSFKISIIQEDGSYLSFFGAYEITAYTTNSDFNYPNGFPLIGTFDITNIENLTMGPPTGVITYDNALLTVECKS